VPPYLFNWIFGDGNTSTQQNTSHTYTEAGTYNVTVTVTDSASHTAKWNTTVIVKPVSGAGASSDLILYGAIVAIIVVIIMAVLIIMMRKKKSPPSETG
jgi:PKD repeat protein